VDERRLYAREATPSMFAYCTEVLHLSEFEAYLRITVARASREHPMLLSMLREGLLHLSGIARLAPHLTLDNREVLLRRAVHKSKRQIEELVAEVTPRADAPAVVRKLPMPRRPGAAAGDLVAAPTLGPDSATPAGQTLRTSELGPDRVESFGLRLDPAGAQSSGLRPARGAAAQGPGATLTAMVLPLSPARFKVQFTASTELRDKLERLQALMRSSVPDGDLAKIIDLAVSEKLERLEAKRFAKTKAPRKGLAGTDTAPKTRYIPAAVRRSVHARDGGQCTYRDKLGRRCTRRHDLEFHHRTPFGRGGEHSPAVLTLMCKAHNLLLVLSKLEWAKKAGGSRKQIEDASAVLAVNPGD
jgi:hypothetical protein